MQNVRILTLTRVAAAAVLAHRFVDFDGTQCDVAGAKPLGVSQYKADAAGHPFAVDILGTALVEAGAAIALGAKGLTPIMTAADGRAIAHDGDAAKAIAGYALQSAGAAGAIIEALLTP
jgi:hypothetical protein